MNSNFKKAFSLIEISIVLIIVALLVAGIVSGKSLITNARMNVLNSELTTLQIAMKNYINNNNLSFEGFESTDPDKQFSIKDLVNDGYLEDDNHIELEDTSYCYKSKTNDNCWKFGGYTEIPSDAFGKNRKYAFVLSLNNKIDRKLCNQFSKKFSKKITDEKYVIEIVCDECSRMGCQPNLNSSKIFIETRIYDINSL